MYFVANMVFYTCGKLDIEKIKSTENLNQLNIIKSTNIKLENYWFSRFDTNSYKYIEFNLKNFQCIFKNRLDVDKLIEKLTIKVHLTGITSVEIYFKSIDELDLAFDRYLDKFIAEYSRNIFDFIYDLNMELTKSDFLTLPESFRFSTLLLDKKASKNKLNSSCLFRVHYFTSHKDNYEEIVNFYSNEKIKSDNTVVEVEDDIYEATIFKDSVLWFSKNIKLDEVSELLDIDSNTMNESIIYKQAGEIYTDLMYEIDFRKEEQIHSNILVEMHKINSYFLQKCRLAELMYIENVDGFIEIQRNIEKFDILEEIFEKAEKNYLDICEVVESNEKAESGRVVQYILVFLTLFTIISVSQGIMDFVNLGFSKEHFIEISFISKVELMIFLLVCILFIFLKISRYIKKS